MWQNSEFKLSESLQLRNQSVARSGRACIIKVQHPLVVFVYLGLSERERCSELKDERSSVMLGSYFDSSSATDCFKTLENTVE